jgi:hypothetical protein
MSRLISMDFIEICNSRNIIQILQYLKGHNMSLITGYNLVVLNGNLELIKWFLTLDIRLYNKISIETFKELILNSDKEILEHLLVKSNYYTNMINEIINNEFREGRIDLLNILIDIIPSSKKYINRNIIQILKVLVHEDNLEALVWLNHNFKHILYTFDDYMLYFIAFQKNYNNLALWLVNLDVKAILNYNANNVFLKACKSGYLELAIMFNKLYNINNYIDCFNLCCSAGMLETATWLYSIVETPIEIGYINACTCGKLDIIEWLLSIDQDTIDILEGIKIICKNNDDYTLSYVLEYLGKKITINDIMDLFNYGDRITYVILNTLEDRGELGETYRMFYNNRRLSYYILTKYPSIRLDFTPYLKLYIIEGYNELCLEIYNNHRDDINITFSDICDLFTRLALSTVIYKNIELLNLLYNLNSSAVDSVVDEVFTSACENSYIDVAMWLYNKYIGRYNVAIDRYNIITSFSIIKPLDIIGGVYIDEVEDCSICMTIISDSITECRHQFCYRCLNKWYLKNPTCPICRTGLHFCSNILLPLA